MIAYNMSTLNTIFMSLTNQFFCHYFIFLVICVKWIFLLGSLSDSGKCLIYHMKQLPPLVLCIIYFSLWILLCYSVINCYIFYWICLYMNFCFLLKFSRNRIMMSGLIVWRSLLCSSKFVELETPGEASFPSLYFFPLVIFLEPESSLESSDECFFLLQSIKNQISCSVNRVHGKWGHWSFFFFFPTTLPGEMVYWKAKTDTW